ncbi:hypothetical protein RUM43_010043 [Polyplax serrata]|uniref:Uncharacterized protein n=1 Tax=Polyplax serrata TaxID=468196 RepID=A0AAN8P3M2_POLSC
MTTDVKVRNEIEVSLDLLPTAIKGDQRSGNVGLVALGHGQIPEIGLCRQWRLENGGNKVINDTLAPLESFSPIIVIAIINIVVVSPSPSPSPSPSSTTT